MRRMFLTERAVFPVIDPIGMFTLVLRVGVVAAFTFAAGEDDFISRHTYPSPEFGVLAARKGRASRSNRN